MRGLLFLVAGSLFAQYNGTWTGTANYTSSSPLHGSFSMQNTTANSGQNWITTAAGAIPASGNFGVSIRIRGTQTAGGQGVFETPNFRIGLAYGGQLQVSINGTVFTQAGTVMDGTTHTIALFQNGTTGTIYVDGANAGSGTVTPVVPGAGATATIGVMNGTIMHTATLIDEVAIWSTGTYTACSPCTGSEANLRALYKFENNANDSAGGVALTAGTLANALGLSLTAATGGTSPYSYQLQSYSGACSSGTFTNDGAALTGQTSSATFSRADGSTKCYRVVVTDSASATANTGTVTAPLSGGSGANMRSN